MNNKIIKTIEKSLKELPFNFSKKDMLILTEWAYNLYLDGYKNSKEINKADEK